MASSEGEGRGSEITVRLPPATAPMDHSPPEDSTGAGTDGEVGRRVLIVDDNVDAAESLAMLLEMQGHSVGTAHSGDGALDALGTQAWDVVLLDIGLPGRDGYEIARIARTRLGAATPLLVALTGWGQDSDRNRAAEAGFDHHLTKPAEPGVVSRLIAQAGTPARRS